MQSKINYGKYLVKANEAIKDVFDNEYYGLLALPRPKVFFIPPGEKYYRSGVHSVQINSDLFSSGVYFYEAQSGEFVNQKKMVILK